MNRASVGWRMARDDRPGYGLAALIDACGVPIAKRATRRPGQILYRDAWQIVAKPEEATPTLWC